jgi:hypothetical protein
MDSFIKVKSNSAIVLKRKQPFVDWIRSLDEEETDFDDFKEEDVLLVPECDTIEQIKQFVKKNFEEIFAFQCFMECMDDEVWPDTSNYKLFQEWFELSYHTMVLSWD